MPPRVWLPNFPIRMRLKAPPNVETTMPPVGTEGTFRTQEVVLETVQSMTKIEMKRLLEAMYGVQVERVHSLNVLGKRKSEHTLMAYKKKDFKRFYVRLTTPVDLPNVPKAIDRLGKDAGAS